VDWYVLCVRGATKNISKTRAEIVLMTELKKKSQKKMHQK